MISIYYRPLKSGMRFELWRERGSVADGFGFDVRDAHLIVACETEAEAQHMHRELTASGAPS